MKLNVISGQMFGMVPQGSRIQSIISVAGHLISDEGRSSSDEPQFSGSEPRSNLRRTPITVLHTGGRDLWMSFLVVENLDDSDQLI